ncbi:HAD family phosphatase [Streptomyces sp. NPDC001480]|uniref:HAD family phosphatase n=1 Tax=Streptomyces sp. NPDC001480 TaxID=3364577 RepID=UPI00367AC825
MTNPPLSTLRLAAVNIDGVLLNDTFSPVIHRFVVRHGVTYTQELEREVLSQPRLVAARVLARAIGSTAAPQEILDAFFEERERYVRTHPEGPLDGAGDLLRRLRALGLDIVCYGGLDARHFERHLGHWASLFAEPRYICTNDFRPGIREIVRDHFGLSFRQAVFIDDAARFAERAKELDVPFIGHPSHFEHGFQRKMMRAAGVRHVVDSLNDIDERLLRTLDREAAEGTVWHGTHAPAVPTGEGA